MLRVSVFWARCRGDGQFGFQQRVDGMRILGLIGLVLVLLIGGFVLEKKTSVQEASMVSGTDPIPPKSGSSLQTRQVQQDIQRSLDAATRTPRDVPDEP